MTFSKKDGDTFPLSLCYNHSDRKDLVISVLSPSYLSSFSRIIKNAESRVCVCWCAIFFSAHENPKKRYGRFFEPSAEVKSNIAISRIHSLSFERYNPLPQPKLIKMKSASGENILIVGPYMTNIHSLFLSQWGHTGDPFSLYVCVRLRCP